MNDDLKKKDEEEIEDVEEVEGGEESESVEPDFAASSTTTPAFDEEDDLEADPHSSFDTIVPVEEDPHLDIYGLGVPHGFNGDEEDEEDDLPEETADFDSF
jgi:hypothetical protein